MISNELAKIAVKALEDKNPNLKYDLYEGVGHDSWNKAFTEKTLKWLLEQTNSE